LKRLHVGISSFDRQGLYVIFFALIMVCFECFSGFALAAMVISRNYGFMFSVTGRILFMVMIGIMVSALDTGSGFAYAMCGITIANAGVNAAVMVTYRDWTAEMVKEHTKRADLQR
jgi:hypothetical protein